MKPDLAKYANMKICVAVSGGKDSMALLHYINLHKAEFGIELSALNCDHRIRGEASARDSAFVKEWCLKNDVPIKCFFEDCIALAQRRGVSVETAARDWRLSCYLQTEGAVATAHHLNDNAETALFNLARGSALSGLTGITDCEFITDDNRKLKLIRPLIECTREEIDNYIEENAVPYVEDESNFSDDYTRNKIRHNVLPELEKAVPGAAKAIYRFSRLAAEDERYFDSLIEKLGLIYITPSGTEIKFCEDRPVFKRAALKAVKGFNVKDYTSEHAERLYMLQFSQNGKKFAFLGLTAYREENKIVISRDGIQPDCEVKLRAYKDENFCGQPLKIGGGLKQTEGKTLKFDIDRVPSTAVIRFMKTGDKFTKFGGGTKSLGDFFTDRKIPVRLRKRIPLIADGSEILAVCGVEISEKIKITSETQNICFIACTDYTL